MNMSDPTTGSAHERKAVEPLVTVVERDEVLHDALKRWPPLASDAYWRFMVDAARGLGAPRIVEIGCGYARHVGTDEVAYTGVDYGYFVEYASVIRPGRQWTKIDFDCYDQLLWEALKDPRAIFFCRGRVEHVRDVELLLDCLASLARESLVVVGLEEGDGRPLRAFLRRRVSVVALSDNFRNRGLEALLLGAIPAPESGAEEEIILVAVGSDEVVGACRDQLVESLGEVLAAGVPGQVEAALERDGARMKDEAIQPDTMLFAPDIRLLSTRLRVDKEQPSPAELDIDAVARAILKAKDDRAPFSLMRLGNGEGRVLGFPDFIPPIWLARSMRNWFGSRTPEFSVASLRNEAADLVAEANLIGVLRPRYPDPQYRLPLSLLELYGLVGPDAALCPANTHLQLLEENFYAELLAGERGISLVCGHALDTEIASAFNLPDVRLFKVPAQAKFFFDPSEDQHFPTVFERLRNDIDVRWPGEIFLIGAGFLGKIYCGWVKRLGGIAVDIGSVFDLWAGETTRGNVSAEHHRLR